MSATPEQQDGAGRRWAVPLVVLGVVLVVAGLAFHGASAAHRAHGLDGTWGDVLDQAALRAAAWVAVAGGTLAVVTGWGARRR